MANMFYGVGDTYAKTLTLPTNPAAGAIGQNVIIPLYLFDFEYTEDVTALEAKGQVKGVRRTLASAAGETVSTLRLSTQFVNWSQLGFFLNQFSRPESNLVVPVLKTAQVPTSSPYTVTDAGITTTNAPGIYVYVNDSVNPGYREIITTGTPAAGEVELDDTADTLTFHSSDAGKYFVYTLPTTKANAQTYGGKGGVDRYGTIEFWGTIYGTEDTIHFPSLDFKTSPSMSFTGDVATLEVEFGANVNIAAGDVYPYRIIKR